MSMSGRRFGVGLAAGVFFALAIVAVSGAFASTSPLFPSQNGMSAATSVTTATTTLSTTTGSVPGIAYTTGGGQSTTVSQTTANPQSSANTTAASGQGSASAPKFSSELATMARLSTPARALLLAPVVLALLIGALLYRASLARKEKEDD